jgi:surface antigen
MPTSHFDNLARLAVAAVAVAALSACASSRRAPIVYAGAAVPVARAPVAEPAPRADDAGYEAGLPYDPANPPAILDGMPISECVPYARKLSGVQIWGDAVTWWHQAEGRYVRSGHPAEGSVLVMKGYNDDKRGHVAVVSAIVSERLIRVDHANWLSSGETSINVPVYDVSAANDWSEVRVWHIPGHYWGGRTYNTQGFIHPYRLDGGGGVSR